MAIHFIPNDPRAGATAPGIRVQSKRPNRPATRSGYTFSSISPEGTALPGTPQFLFWQCREAALATLGAWESSAGIHKLWQGNRKKLPLRQDAGDTLNAFYDRASFSFFHKTIGVDTFFSGASTDVVAHEVGHGLLDSIRADFFGVNALEVGAFHEAFGDCMAILTALGDKETRQKLLAVTATLRKKNFVETTAEDLSFGIKKLMPTHNAAEPRHAFNTFQYQLPQSLPSNGGPGELINEEHSFGMVFTGCFWDLIANIFAASPVKSEATLAAAAALAGKILIAGTKAAVLTSRFLLSVGRGMILADQSLHAGANRDHIRAAFLKHSIQLGSNSMIAPTMSLAGEAPSGGALAASTRKDLMLRLGAQKGTKMKVAAANFFGTAAVNAIQTREVSLSSVDKALKGVVCMAYDSITVGESGGRAAVLGMMPNTVDTDSEVKDFVGTLLTHDRIDLGQKKTAAAITKPAQSQSTHAIIIVGGRKVLSRVRFNCSGAHC